MTLKELLEKKGKLAQEIRQLADKANDKDHEWSGEDEQTWERVNAAFDDNEEAIATENTILERLDRATAIESALEDTRSIGLHNRTAGTGNTDGAETAITDEHRSLSLQAWLRNQNGLNVTDEQREACQITGVNPDQAGLDFRLGQFTGEAAWSRGGNPMLESRGLTVGTNADGGFTVPQGFVTELERTMLAYNGPRQVSRIIRTDSGNELDWPTVNDTGNVGALLAEEGSIGSSVDATFAQKKLNAYKYSSKPILISAELLQDSAFNMGQVIPSLLGERLGRIQAQHFTTGTGSSQPNGVVTASTLGVTAAGAAAVTANEIIDLVHSIDPAYRTAGSVGFMLHDGVLKAIRKLQDGDNQYLWQPGMQAGIPDRIFNYPYTINQNMQATLATGTKTILFGDFQKFVIRDVQSVRLFRLEERYRDNDQTGFVAFMRSDSECIQTAAIKHLIQA